MNTTHTCPECGKPVAPTGLQGLCPECMMKVGLAAQTGESPPNATQAAAPPPPAPKEIAKFFPQLEVLECLGRGGMGAVYKARQPKLDRFVALKILLRRREEGAADTAFGERFAREARALARLDHPSIVAVHDFGEAGGYPFLLMEFVDGLTLRQLLERGKLQPEEALAIVPKICDALQFAHQRGVVHRDIKPENILLDKQGRVKIADFGIAKILAPGAQDLSLTGARDVVGTPHYMAPEQIEQPAKVDHRADIFSLGVVLYEMLTGELPLGKFAPPSQKVQVDVRLDEVVLHALEKEPERRYQHASEVKTDVETIAGTSSAAAPTPATTEPAGGISGWLRRRLLPEDTAARWAQLVCFGVAIVILVLGLLKLPQFDLQPHELFFGVILVLILTLVMLVAGYLVGAGPNRPKGAIARAPDTPAGGGLWRPRTGLRSKPWIIALVVVLVGLGVTAWLIRRSHAARASTIERHKAELAVRTARAPKEPPPKSQAQAEQEAVSFGPMRERFVNDIDDHRGGECLVLETGELLDFLLDDKLKQLPKGQEQQWLDERHVNLIVDTVGGQHGLGLRNSALALVSNDRWDNPQEAALEKALRSGNPGVTVKTRQGFDWYLLPTNAAPPITFALRMGAAGLGVLQVVTWSEAPGGAMIRYRLANLPVNRTTTPTTPTQQGSLPAARADRSEIRVTLTNGVSVEVGAQAAGGFGPVIEREVCFSFITDRSDRFLDLDRDQFVNPPPEMGQHFAKGAWIGWYSGVESKEAGEAMKSWVRLSGVDLLADGWQKRLTLLGGWAFDQDTEQADLIEFDRADPKKTLQRLLGIDSEMRKSRDLDTRLSWLQPPGPYPTGLPDTRNTKRFRKRHDTFLFRTAADAFGILQFGEFRENPPRVSFRYRLLQRDAIQPPLVAPVTSAPFSRDTEVTLTEFNNMDGQEGLDFETGTVFAQPKDMDKWTEAGLAQWIQEQGIDLFVDEGPRKQWGLLTTTVAPLQLAWITNDNWAIISERELDRALLSGRVPTHVPPMGILKVYPLTKDAPTAMTLAFKTSTGSKGLLHIAGFTEKPRGVTILYKLIPPPDKATH